MVFKSRGHWANDLFTCIYRLITIHQYIIKCPNYATVNKIELAFSCEHSEIILTSFAIFNIPFIRQSLRETNLAKWYDEEYVNKAHFGEDSAPWTWLPILCPSMFALGSHILSIRSWKLLNQSSWQARSETPAIIHGATNISYRCIHLFRYKGFDHNLKKKCH